MLYAGITRFDVMTTIALFGTKYGYCNTFWETFWELLLYVRQFGNLV
jgi:hypothetical protein